MCHQLMRQSANAVLLSGACVGTLSVTKRICILVQYALDAFESDIFAIKCVKQSIGDL